MKNENSCSTVKFENTYARWMERFNQYDVKQSEANGGTGYVGPLPELGYTPSHVLGWEESYVLKGYLGAYRATKETDYLDKFVEDVDSMFQQMEDYDGDSYKSWWTPSYSVNMAINGDMENDSNYYKDAIGAYMPDGWYPYPWYGKKETIYRTNKEKAVGDYSIFVQNSLSESFVAAYTIFPNYTQDKNYNITFKAKNLNDESIGKAMVVRQDTGETIQEFEFSCPEWKDYSFDFRSPKEAGVQLRLYLSNTGGEEHTDTGTYYDIVSIKQYGEYVVHEGMVLTAVAEFIDIVFNDHRLRNKYGKHAKHYLFIIEEHFIPKWENYWAEWTKDGVKMGTYTFPFDDTARMTQINEYYPFLEPSKGITLPHNQNAAPGRTLVHLYKATGRTEYLDKAVKLGQFLKSSLIKRDTDSGMAYVWNYWNNSGGNWDFGYFRYTLEDVSHANIDLGLAVDLFQAGEVFTEEDMMTFSTTFKRLIWQQDYNNPRVSMYVDGTGNSNAVLISEWVTLSQFDKEIRDIAVSLLQRPADTFSATYGMITIGNLLRYNPELLND
ncbi:hypothetical protein [Fictibacillus sp. NRS-1165]|uniref:hypothetical protein n=1 Tax=Fictibacillus sp. NRS-1165 TaxID=3144463 RepID=UPI003D1C3D4E